MSPPPASEGNETSGRQKLDGAENVRSERIGLSGLRVGMSSVCEEAVGLGKRGVEEVIVCVCWGVDRVWTVDWEV